MAGEFRVKLVDSDGNLLCNEIRDQKYWFYDDNYLVPDVEFALSALGQICRERGLSLCSYEHTSVGVSGLVDYL